MKRLDPGRRRLSEIAILVLMLLTFLGVMLMLLYAVAHPHGLFR